MSQTTCDRLEQTGGYIIEPRGPIEIKGKGKMNTYWLLGKKGFDKVLPTPPPIGWVTFVLHYIYDGKFD
jgi:guanylate cyclase 2F